MRKRFLSDFDGYFYLLCPLHLSVSQRGGWLPLTHGPWSTISGTPRQTSCPNMTPPPLTPPQKRTTMYYTAPDKCACVFARVWPLSVSMTRMTSLHKKWVVCLELVGCPEVAMTTSSSIPWERELEVYHSEKLLKEEKKQLRALEAEPDG